MDKRKKHLDLLIIGAGVAGLTAGIYASRMKLNSMILENQIVGGQIQDSYMVDNYPGFSKITGSELIEKMRVQAVQGGTELDEFDQIVSLVLTDEEKVIETKSAIYLPMAVIIAAGMKRRELPIPEETQYRGRGIHYCELCDGHMYNDKAIAVVGGGNAALDAALFLRKYAPKIYLIHQFDAFTADKLTQEKVKADQSIHILLNSRIVHGLGVSGLTSVIVENTVTKAEREIELSAVFVKIGAVPQTELYKDYIYLDENGSIVATETCETNVNGVYAAGDIRSKPFRQLTTAVADGTVAALMAEKYIKQKG